MTSGFEFHERIWPPCSVILSLTIWTQKSCSSQSLISIRSSEISPTGSISFRVNGCRSPQPPYAGSHWPSICCRISMMHGIPLAISAAYLHALRSDGGLTFPASSLTWTKKIWLPSRKDKWSRIGGVRDARKKLKVPVSICEAKWRPAASQHSSKALDDWCIGIWKLVMPSGPMQITAFSAHS